MGLIHIYCGDGKGKTTAALGLAIRASGSGMRVHFVLFLKGTDTAEFHSLALLPNISVERCDRNYGFTFSMSAETRNKLVCCHNEILQNAEQLMHSEAIDLLILDEFNAAYEFELFDRNLADRLVLTKPERIELVLTGRNPRPKFVQAADYVSELKQIKHPYTNGITARKGIEY